MVGHLRIRSPWSQLSLFLGLFGMCYVLGGFIAIMIYDANGISLLPGKTTDLSPHTIAIKKIVQALSSVMFFLLPAFIFALLTFKGNYGYFLGFKKAEKGNMYVLAPLCILLALPFVFWLGTLNQHIPLPKGLTSLEQEAAAEMDAFLKVNHPVDIVINIVIIALLPAICEELCFRGILQRILINLTKSPWAGIILAAILFSALHLQFEGFLPRMFLGIVLGAFYWYSGSLWTNILAHFVNNAVQVLVVTYAPKYVNVNPDTPLLAAIASAIAVWAILWFYCRQSTITYAKVFRVDDLTPTNQFIA